MPSPKGDGTSAELVIWSPLGPTVGRYFSLCFTRLDASPVASLELVHLVVAHAATSCLVLKQVEIKTAFLRARILRPEKAVYVIPPKGLEFAEEQPNQVWRLQAWLYSLRLSPRGWWDTVNAYLLEIRFVYSTADPCLYI